MLVRQFSFNDESGLGGDYAANFGTIPGTSANPVIDRTVQYHGQNTMRFDIPSQSGANAGGNWFGNFSSDLKTQFGAGDKFYVDVPTLWNDALFDTVFMAEKLDSAGKPIPGTVQQAGVKLFDVNFGDEVGSTPASTVGHHYSSAGGKIVVQTRYQCRFPWLYAYDSDSNNTPFQEAIAGDFKEQNAMPAPFCLYSKSSGKTGPIAGCFNIVRGKWMLWRLAVEMGPLGVDKSGFPVWTQSRTRLFGAVDGQPFQLLIDWNQNVPGYFDRRAVDTDKTKPLKMGKVWAFPYITSKDATQVHPLCQAWYGPITINSGDPMSNVTVYDPTSEVTVINAAPPVDQSAEVTALQAQVATLTAEVTTLQGKITAAQAALA